MKTIQQWEKELTSYAKQWVKEEFGIDFTLSVKSNGRLKSTLGVYTHSGKTPVRVNIAKGLIESGRDADVYDVLRHELIHYSLHQLGLPHRDDDREFIEACTKRGVGLTRTLKGFHDKHVYTCKCGLHKVKYTRNNKISSKNLSKYIFPKCGHELIYVGRESDNEVKFK